MAELNQPSRGETPHDFLRPVEQVDANFEANYQDRLHRFRASVVDLFQKNEVDDMSRVWLAFDTSDRIPEPPEPGHDRLTAVRSQIMPPNGRDRKHSELYIRLLTNETFPDLEGTDYLKTETAVDHDGDAQHLIELNWLEKEYDFDAGFGGEEEQPFDIPFAFADENGLYLHGELAPFTPLGEVQGLDGKKVRSVLPYGIYTDDVDKSYALNYAQNLIDELTGREPVVAYYPDEDED